MSRFTYIAIAFLIIAAQAGAARFSYEDEDGRFTVLDGGEPVLVYNYAMVAPPDGRDADRLTRACYIHPVYGLDGEVLTQDFPADHRHQRGVFWAWPQTKVGDKPLNTWEMDSGQQIFEKFRGVYNADEYIQVYAQSSWQFRGGGEPQVREVVDFRVHKADDKGRAIDFTIRLKNLSDETITLLGATGKGYGGFCFRPSAERKPMIFTADDGRLKRDALEYETPWADVSFHLEPDGPMAGAAIFQHPSNPGYPHHGWIMRKYALLGAAWPHVDPYAIAPGDEITLRYRLYIHRGDAESADVAGRFGEFIESIEATP